MGRFCFINPVDAATAPLRCVSPLGDFRVGPQDVFLGEIGGCKFYIGAAQFAYWEHTQLLIDVVPGRGSGFSVEAPEGVRFSDAEPRLYGRRSGGACSRRTSGTCRLTSTLSRRLNVMATPLMQ